MIVIDMTLVRVMVEQSKKLVPEFYVTMIYV